MSLLSSDQSIAQNIVEFVADGHGRYPAMVIKGIDQGTCDLVVFGAPQIGGEGKVKPRVGAQFVANVPFGQKNRIGSERNGLYPYWETR